MALFMNSVKIRRHHFYVLGEVNYNHNLNEINML